MKPSFALALALALLSALASGIPARAVPLDGIEQRVLEEHRRSEALEAARGARRILFREETRKQKKARPRTVEVHPAPETVDATLLRAPARDEAREPVRAPEPQEEYRVDTDPKKPIAVLPPKSESRLVFGAGAVDTTRYKDVRSTSFNVGMGYKLTPTGVLGLEAERELNDPWDAEYSGRASEEDQSMNVKYKFQF